MAIPGSVPRTVFVGTAEEEISVARAVWSKGDKPFDPEVWRTELFASDEELAHFLDDIYASRQAAPAT